MPTLVGDTDRGEGGRAASCSAAPPLRAMTIATTGPRSHVHRQDRMTDEMTSCVETAPALRLYSTHAARMARLLRLRPALIPRILFAPRPALHAVGAFLHLAPEASGLDIEVAEIMESRDPRDLLLAAIPRAPARLYRAFDRAGDSVLSHSFYTRLSALLDTPMADQILTGGYLNEQMFNKAESLLAMDPVIVGLRGILTCSDSAIEALATLFAFFRGHGAISDESWHPPKEAGLPAMFRRLSSVLDSMKAPKPSFAVTAPLRILASVAELRAVGARLQNCVEKNSDFGPQHWINLVNGTTVYIACEEPPFLAALAPFAPGVYMLEQLAGPNNEPVSVDEQMKFLAALRAAGLVIVKQCPGRALTRIADRYPSTLRRTVIPAS